MQFQSTTDYKIDSEHTQDYTKLFPVLKIYHLFRLISDDFWLKVPRIAKKVPWFLADVRKDGYTFNKYILQS